jgi:hypothetical protein
MPGLNAFFKNVKPSHVFNTQVAGFSGNGSLSYLVVQSVTKINRWTNKLGREGGT